MERDPRSALRPRDEEVRRVESIAAPLDHDRAWLHAGLKDQARALAAVGGETPSEELAEYLRDMGGSATPIRWNPSRQAFEKTTP